MVEPRHIQMLSSVTLDHPRISGMMSFGHTKKNAPKARPTIRLNLELFPSSSDKCPEFNYVELRKQNSSDDGSKDLFPGGTEEDELKSLAKKYEEKYGPSSHGKKKGKKYFDDFIDIGYGYDESDSFLDNSEAYDEVVPSDWTTEYGGFYINQGDLDFRPVSQAPAKVAKSVKSPKKRKLLKSKSDEKTLKKKHLLNKEKKLKKQAILITRKKQSQKSKALPVVVNEDSRDANIPLSQVKNTSFEDDMPLAKNTSFEDDMPLAKYARVADSQEDDIPLAKIVEKVPSAVLSTSVKTSADAGSEVCSVASSSSSGTVSVISSSPSTALPTEVTCAATSSIASYSAGTSTSTVKCSPSPSLQLSDPSDADSPKVAKVETPLPPGVGEELLKDIFELKQIALAHVKGKGKFFNPTTNDILLRFARNVRKLPPRLRSLVNDHVLFYLPCAKDTLVKKCRALVVKHQVDLMEEPMAKLRNAVAAVMPALQKVYDEEVAKALQQQVREQMKNTGVDPSKIDNKQESSLDEDGTKKNNFPKRKFVWTDEIRLLLCDVVKVRVGLYKMSKHRSLTPEEYIKDFLEADVRKLWPKGWMTSRILYKESKQGHCEITSVRERNKKAKAIVDITSSQSSTSPSVVTITAKVTSTPSDVKTVYTASSHIKTSLVNPVVVCSQIPSSIINDHLTSNSYVVAEAPKSLSVCASSVSTKEKEQYVVPISSNGQALKTLASPLNSVISCAVKSSSSSLTIGAYSKASLPTIKSSVASVATPVLPKQAVVVTTLKGLSPHLKIVTNTKSISGNNAKLMSQIAKSSFLVNARKSPVTTHKHDVYPTLVKNVPRHHIVPSEKTPAKDVPKTTFPSPSLSAISDSSVDIGSPKVSPFVATPPSASRASVLTEHERSHDDRIVVHVPLKRHPPDSLAADEKPVKRTAKVLSNYSTPSTGQSVKSWCEMETELLHLSKEAQTLHRRLSLTETRPSPLHTPPASDSLHHRKSHSAENWEASWQSPRNMSSSKTPDGSLHALPSSMQSSSVCHRRISVEELQQIKSSHLASAHLQKKFVEPSNASLHASRTVQKSPLNSSFTSPPRLNSQSGSSPVSISPSRIPPSSPLQNPRSSPYQLSHTQRIEHYPGLLVDGAGHSLRDTSARNSQATALKHAVQHTHQRILSESQYAQVKKAHPHLQHHDYGSYIPKLNMSKELLLHNSQHNVDPSLQSMHMNSSSNHAGMPANYKISPSSQHAQYPPAANQLGPRVPGNSLHLHTLSYEEQVERLKQSLSHQ